MAEITIKMGERRNEEGYNGKKRCGGNEIKTT